MAKIGVDEWVAQEEERREKYSGVTAPIRRIFDNLAPGWKLALFALVGFLFPFFAGSDFQVRVGINVLLLAMLALGLNVVVGWAGLLDLGFIAFYGFGAYLYAILSSAQFDVHWPTLASVVVVILASALMGFILGLPSRRLVGDYLAIMTLFFAQLFLELANNLDRLSLPWSDDTLNLTGGPNGIPGVDRWSFFGLDITTFQDYFWLLLALTVVLIILLHNLNQSRTGRAWRAQREDGLAARHMTMPVNSLKLMAFSLGAAIAGFTGSIFAAVQVGVFPQNFELILLITVYAAVVLGGSGSIPGVIVGAVVIAAVPEILRDPNAARWMFYGLLIVTIIARVRPWPRLVALVAGVTVFGFVVRWIATAIWDTATTGDTAEGFMSGVIDGWILLPGSERDFVTNVAFILMMVGVLAATQLRGWTQTVVMIPTLYLAIFVWENKLVFQPSVTRQLLFGAILVVMMAVRPHGLLGTPRVEVV